MAIKISETSPEQKFAADGTPIIEGMFLDIKTEKLKGLLLERAAFHEKKRISHVRLAEARKKELGEVQQESGFQNVTQQRGLDDAALAESHRAQRDWLTFEAENIIEGVTYRFSESEVIRLELIPRAQ